MDENGYALKCTVFVQFFFKNFPGFYSRSVFKEGEKKYETFIKEEWKEMNHIPSDRHGREEGLNFNSNTISALLINAVLPLPRSYGKRSTVQPFA